VLGRQASLDEGLPIRRSDLRFMPKKHLRPVRPLHVRSVALSNLPRCERFLPFVRHRCYVDSGLLKRTNPERQCRFPSDSSSF
jgi:hypothetical protein